MENIGDDDLLILGTKPLRVIFEPGNVWGFYREAPDSGSKITSFDIN